MCLKTIYISPSGDFLLTCHAVRFSVTAGSLRKSPAQDIKPTPLSKPSFSTSTTLAKSRTLPSTTTTAKEKLTPGAARRTQSVKDRVTR